MISEFTNEPLTNFSNPEPKQAILAAIETVRGTLGKTYPIWINGEEVKEAETFPSLNPSKTSEIIGHFQRGTTQTIDRAIEAGWNAFTTWSKTPAKERADYLFRASAKMREQKHHFSAWMVLETGKSWVEADADTAEAIDFMEFYGREMLRMSEPQPLTPLPGEKNDFYYLPLGVGAVIPPWNFPLAICVGMATAAIVSGNCVVLKPSSDSAGIAYQFVELMNELGLPKGVLNFVTGKGAEVGDHLTGHPKIRFISFTGSKEVGLRINQLAAKANEGQKWIKRVILEMGGKDAMLFDEGVDVEEAASGIVAAAFGFQGQKCSACSRAVIHESIYDQVVKSVVEKTEKLKIACPTSADTNMGPVISQSAFKKIMEYIEIGKKEGKLMTGGKALSPEGYFIAPTVIADVPPTARISLEEIFGPVLAMTKVKSFDEGLDVVNNTEYGLTGAAYSPSRENIEKARRDFFVGNLYFNRKCTGALVGVHPFGGFNMSGTDSKAGGRDYLLLFTQGKLVSEKV